MLFASAECKFPRQWLPDGSILFDLTTLQREASQRYGFTLDRTLRCAQSLYEASKAITYPRTSSRFLPDDYGPEIPVSLVLDLTGPLRVLRSSDPDPNCKPWLEAETAVDIDAMTRD